MSEDAALMEALSGNSLNLDTSIDIVPPVVKTTETKSTDEELMNGLSGNVTVTNNIPEQQTIANEKRIVSDEKLNSIRAMVEKKTAAELNGLLKLYEEQVLKFKGVDIEAADKKRDLTVEALSAGMMGEGLNPTDLQGKFLAAGDKPYNIGDERYSSEFEAVKQYDIAEWIENFQNQKERLIERLSDPNVVLSGGTDALLNNTNLSISSINAAVTSSEWAPVTSALHFFAEMPEELEEVKKLWGEGRELAAAGKSAANLGFGILHAMGLSSVLGKTASKLGSKGEKVAIKRFADADKKAKVKSDVKLAKAKEVADLNPKVREEIRLAYAESLDPSLVKVVNGVKEIDYDAVRIAGRKKAEEVYNLSKKRVDDTLRGNPIPESASPAVKAAYNVSEEQVFLGLVDEASELVSPLLNPAKLDAIVAIASDVQKAGVKFDPNKTVIDNLFDLTAEGKLLAEGADGLPELLGKYGLSFDDYVLSISGSASEAGKILQKMSMIRKADPNASASARAIETANIESTLKRLENMRRGIMTSQIKTAARNLQSVFIRSPFDGLETVSIDVLKSISDEGILKGATTAFTADTWKKGFGHWKYMFRKGGEGKQLTEYILKNPGLSKKYDDLLGTVSELRRRTGGDSGKVLPHLEKITDSLMVFNRQQDFFVRRATFSAKIQQLTKNEFGEELFQIIDRGDIDSLVQGLGKYGTKGRKGKKSFAELTDEAIRESLERTYASRPQIDVFDDIARTWSKYPALTLVEEFPRFVLSSLEYITEASGAGLFMPAVRKFKGYQNRRMKEANRLDPSRGNPDSWKIREKGILGSLIETEGDRRQISRGMIGFATVMGMAKWMQESDNLSEDYKIFPTVDGNQVDVTPFFPVRQIAFLSRWSNELAEGTAAGWFEAKEFIETFTGSQFKTGQSNPLLDGIAEIASGILNEDTDVFSTFKMGELASRIFGDKATTILMPYNYVTDFQRSFGWRTKRLVDVKKDPNQGSGFWGGVTHGLRRTKEQKGYNLPSSDDDRPDRVNPYNTSSERFAPILNLSLGWRQTDRDDKWTDTWKARGFKGWQTGKRTMIPSIKRVEAIQLNKLLAGQTESIEEQATIFRNRYNSFSPEKQKKISKTIFGGSSVEGYVDNQLKPIMAKRMSDIQQLVYDKPEETADIIVLQEGFRTLYSKNKRQAASLKFRERNNGDRPDYLSIKDVLILYDYADQSIQPNLSDLPAYKKAKKKVGESKYLTRVNKIRKARGKK